MQTSEVASFSNLRVWSPENTENHRPCLKPLKDFLLRGESKLIEQGEVASLLLKNLEFKLRRSKHQLPGPGGASKSNNSCEDTWSFLGWRKGRDTSSSISSLLSTQEKDKANVS